MSSRARAYARIASLMARNNLRRMVALSGRPAENSGEQRDPCRILRDGPLLHLLQSDQRRLRERLREHDGREDLQHLRHVGRR